MHCPKNKTDIPHYPEMSDAQSYSLIIPKIKHPLLKKPFHAYQISFYQSGKSKRVELFFVQRDFQTRILLSTHEITKKPSRRRGEQRAPRGWGACTDWACNTITQPPRDVIAGGQKCRRGSHPHFQFPTLERTQDFTNFGIWRPSLTP